MRMVVTVALVLAFAGVALAGGPREYRQGLVAHYYQDKEEWGGNWPDDVSVPTVPASAWTFTSYAYSRVEPLINHQFIRNGWFSIRWVGYINVEPGASGDGNPTDPVNIAFEMWADDGARLFIDGQALIDDWRACWEKSPESHRGVTVNLTPGYHRIVIEYFQGQSLEKDDRDPAKLYWSIDGRKEIVSSANLFHTDEDLETR